MIRVSGRKNVVGSPFLYRTTKDFLIHFGLNDIRDLPRLEEFGDLIGESLNEDVVAAITNAEPTDPQLIDETTPVSEDGITFEADGGNDADEAQSAHAGELESAGTDQQRE
jgi:segregation and condensation protein B